MTRPFFRLAALALGPAMAAVLSQGCGVETVGVDACRKIEQERCVQAPPCPNLKVSDVNACKRFYRDQCLHGLTLESEPGDPVVDKCVAAVKAAGACAKAAPGAPCANVSVSRAGATACDVLEHPEIAVDCSWIVPPPPSTATPATTDAGADAADGS